MVIGGWEFYKENIFFLFSTRITHYSTCCSFLMKILHISDVDVRETKMMGSSPVIIVAVCLSFFCEQINYCFSFNKIWCGHHFSMVLLQFQTQQIHCVRDINGEITEGGKVGLHVAALSLFF